MRQTLAFTFDFIFSGSMVIPTTSVFGTYVLLVLDFKPFENNNYV